jgi:hypothetical protein
MTEDELEAIEARIAAVQRLPITDINTAGWITPEQVAVEDAPKLAAEVRRLRTENRAWRTWTQEEWNAGVEFEGTDEELRSLASRVSNEW